MALLLKPALTRLIGNLPTQEPTEAGILWSNNGALTLSQGLAAEVPIGTFFVAVGDSITAGQENIASQTGSQGQTITFQDTVGFTYNELWADSDTTGLLIAENRAVGGTGLSDAITDATALDARLAANPGKEYYLLSVAMGRNDGILPGSDASYNGGASWIEQFRTYLTARRSAGWNKIIVCTITPYNNETESDRVFREVMNDRIRGLVTSGHADACCDYGNSQTSFMGSVTAHLNYDFVYYADYVHPTRAGHVKLFEVFSPIANALIVQQAVTSAPVISPLGGNYSSNQTITITCPTPGASIYYTTNGTTPTALSTLYTGPFSQGSGTVKAIAIKSGLANSGVNTQVYTVATGLFWNLADVEAGVTVSNGNRRITPVSANNNRWIRANSALPSSGKFIIELVAKTNISGAIYGGLGMIKTSAPLASDCNNTAISAYWKQFCHGGVTADGTNALIGTGEGHWAATAGNFLDGTRVGLAIDMDNGKGWMGVNGSTWNAHFSTDCDPVAGISPHWRFTPAADWFFAGSLYQSQTSNPAWEIPTTIVGTIPTGYTGLNA